MKKNPGAAAHEKTTEPHQMIKISKICDKNKNEFYDDVKKSYLDLLEKIKKDEKDTYNIKNRNKIIDYFYEGDKICENKVIEVITGDRKVLEKVIKEIGVLEKSFFVPPVCNDVFVKNYMKNLKVYIIILRIESLEGLGVRK